MTGKLIPYYNDGTCVIYHANCLEAMPLIDTADHVITDPPYAADVYIRSSRTGCPPAANKLYGGQSLYKLRVGEIGAMNEDILPLIADEVGRLVKRWAIVFSDVESCFRWRAGLELAGLRYVRTGAWVKPDAMPQMSGDRPAVGFEPATICHAQGGMRWNGGGQLGVWTHYTNKGIERPDHPCPKPESLMRELVELFTDPGETILDPFMGSGTTLLAAKRLGRKAIGIEMEEKYCEIAARRLSQGALDLFVTPSVGGRQDSLMDAVDPAGHSQSDRSDAREKGL